MSNKRHNVISKDSVYMLIAKIISKRSKDPNTQVGAVIVSEDDLFVLSFGSSNKSFIPYDIKLVNTKNK